MNLQVDIQNACEEPVPEEDDIRRWIAAALQQQRDAAEVSVRLVSEAEMQQLNERFRGKAAPTNVLSFPAGLPDDVAHPLLGDIVVCAAVVAREASEQRKPDTAHWAHMLVHGALHLVGYDHVEPAEADAMESLETEILAGLSYPCPYEGDTALAGIAGMG